MNRGEKLSLERYRDGGGKIRIELSYMGVAYALFDP